MTEPVSGKYKLLEKLSANALSQSWLAERISDNWPCFVKTTNPDSDVPPDEQRNLLLGSLSCQQGIRNYRFLTAYEKSVDRGRLFITYPRFDAGRWQTLSAERLVANHATLLPRIFLLIDFLHLLDYAHCDIKLDNFIVDSGGTRPCLRLIDLDFLCPVGSSPHARIIGSPEHIAPEILNNEKILARSDNYSLGVMLDKAIEDSGSALISGTRERLVALIGELTARDAMHRPRILIDALRKHEIIDAGTHDELQRELVAMLIMNRYREVGAKRIRERGLGKAVLDSCRILGLRPELADSLHSVFEFSPRKTSALLKRIVRECNIDRLGEYWHLSLSEELLIEMYNACAVTVGQHPPIPASRNLTTTAEVRKAITESRDFYERDNLQTAHLINKRVAEACRMHPDLLPREEFDMLLYETSDITLQMGRQIESREILQELVDSQISRNEVNPEYAFTLVRQSITAMSVEDLEKLVALGARAAEQQGRKDEALRMRCCLASGLCIHGEPQRAFDLLKEISDEARSLNSPAVDALVSYVSGYVMFLQGKYIDAERHFHDSYTHARTAGLDSEILLGALGVAWAMRAEYRLTDSVKMTRSLLNLDSIKKQDRWRANELARNLVACYTRLSDYKKAEYWMNKCREEVANEPDGAKISVIYHGLTFLETVKEDLEAAKEAAAISLEFVGRGLTALNEAKTYTLLTEIACYQGDAQRLEEYSVRAREMFQRMKNEGSILELDLLLALNKRNESDQSIFELPEIVKNLAEHGSLWDAGYGLLYLILDGRIPEVSKLIDTHSKLREMIDLAEIPVLAAVKSLRPMLGPDGAPESTIVALKSAYRVLESAGLYFHAMHTCRRIAAEYADSGRNKLALKFLQQAMTHARQLKNNAMISQLNARIQEIQQTESDRSRIVTSLHSISEILRHIDDYSRSLEQIVRFAVDQTGAERGVLLEKKQQSDELRVRAFVNCDDESLRDITDISMRVPQQVAHQTAPLILDNALTDKRTKDYGSIVAHNILSVICIPVEQNGKVLGVLYLDHHTIPALFDEDDVVYIKSIANFIGVMLSAIGSYRDIGIINRELVEEVNSRTGTDRFITEDPGLRDLFSKLPEIARMNMPVLIQGESGTGKEIICELIHGLSQRAGKPLVKMNCAALSESMLEGELFGVAPHSATGVDPRDGKFSAADGGTLFLDEIGDMPLAAQAKILRAVENQEFEKVGSNKVIRTDIRFIYATNRDLGEMVANGTFRQDLYHRISGYTFEIPPLRKRSNDVWPLIEHFVAHFSQGKRAPLFSHDAQKALLAYDWPGNVRELRNMIERFCILRGGETIGINDLPDTLRSAASDPKRQKEQQEQMERIMLEKALKKNNWNVKRTAENLDLPYSTLQNKIKKYNLKRPN